LQRRALGRQQDGRCERNQSEQCESRNPPLGLLPVVDVAGVTEFAPCAERHEGRERDDQARDRGQERDEFSGGYFFRSACIRRISTIARSSAASRAATGVTSMWGRTGPRSDSSPLARTNNFML
jgi:hypothetical protein